MKSAKVEQALNKQINAELYSSYLYLSMAAFFESHDLQGFAKWFRLQADEEYGHGMKIFDYINDIGGKVTLSEIKGPKTSGIPFSQYFRKPQSTKKKLPSQ